MLVWVRPCHRVYFWASNDLQPGNLLLKLFHKGRDFSGGIRFGGGNVREQSRDVPKIMSPRGSAWTCSWVLNCLCCVCKASCLGAPVIRRFVFVPSPSSLGSGEGQAGCLITSRVCIWYLHDCRCHGRTGGAHPIAVIPVITKEVTIQVVSFWNCKSKLAYFHSRVFVEIHAVKLGNLHPAGRKGSQESYSDSLNWVVIWFIFVWRAVSRAIWESWT